MKIITTDELKSRLDSGPLAIFDVRGDIAYEKGHIPGAKTAPLGSLVFRVASIMDADSEIVVYAQGGDSLARDAVQRLENLRHTNVYAYEEGIDGWQRAGMPVMLSTNARVYTQGPVTECRPLIVDRERAYGGAFKGEPSAVESAGG
jgi:rhodanese-related sulfurtransferase